jgi:hypothetical protein
MKLWTPSSSAAIGLLAGATIMNLMSPRPAPAPSVGDERCAPERAKEATWLAATAPRLPPPSSDHAARSSLPPSAAAPAIVFQIDRSDPQDLLTPEQRRALARQRYGGLIRELALAPDGTARLLEALSQPDVTHEAIVAAIGDRDAARFEALKASLPARQELRRLRDQLEDIGEPLSEEQYRALIRAVSAQSGEKPSRPPQGESAQDSLELYRDWLSEREHTLHADAAKVLTSSQLSALDESQAVREAMRPTLRSSSTSDPPRAGSGG